MLQNRIWILLCSWLVASGWILSLFKSLTATGYLVSLALLAVLLRISFIRNQEKEKNYTFFWIRKIKRRFGNPIPLIYLIYLLIVALGGALYSPTNYDGLCYRIPKILHWWYQGQWHWIGGQNVRMDFSSAGFEWLMLPILVLLKTDRLFFLINLISFALLPGLIYSAYTRLGISKRVAWYWMWLMPCGYCFTLQAGSISNDCFAAVYLLSAMTFALRAKANASWSDAALALLSTALLTGAKASNLPLLLPLLFLLAPLFTILIRRPLTSLTVIILAALISFLPIAIANTVYTGDWSGDPTNHEQFKLKNPIAGLIGNTLQLSTGAIEPPILPMAKLWSVKAENLLKTRFFASLEKEFPRISLKFGELPNEESAGLGIGVTSLILISLISGLLRTQAKVISESPVIFGGLAWISLLVLMAKFGNDGISRLIACYYIILPLPIFALRSQTALVRQRWWRTLAILAQLLLLPALLLSPARPLVPVTAIIKFLENHGYSQEMIQRVKVVYATYKDRSDQFSTVRAHIPLTVEKIGFAGTGDESEYSFWKPLLKNNVIDMNTVFLDQKWPSGLDCIVGSEWGFHDRYHCSPSEEAALIGGLILWSGNVKSFAGRDAMPWYVIVPKKQ